MCVTSTGVCVCVWWRNSAVMAAHPNGVSWTPCGRCVWMVVVCLWVQREDRQSQRPALILSVWVSVCLNTSPGRFNISDPVIHLYFCPYTDVLSCLNLSSNFFPSLLPQSISADIHSFSSLIMFALFLTTSRLSLHFHSFLQCTILPFLWQLKPSSPLPPFCCRGAIIRGKQWNINRFFIHMITAVSISVIKTM